MPNRRYFLAATGAALLTPVLLPNGRTAYGAEPADPTAPWHAAASSTHPDWRVRAFGWAVLAPNPHNRQPWLLQPVGAADALLLAQLDRRLPVTDPLDRQITIGLGAAAELYRMAAAEIGRRVRVEPFPDGVPTGRLDQRPVARLVAEAGPPDIDPLFHHAATRRSAKLPYDLARPVPAASLAQITGAARYGSLAAATSDEGRVAELRALTWTAWQTELTTPPAHLESVNLMRLGRAEVAANPDGISLMGPGLDEPIARGVITRDRLADVHHPAAAPMIDRYRDMLAATPAYLWSSTPVGGLAAAFNAGRDWLRLNLAATGEGLGFHPVSQALQEFAEMRAAYDAVHQALGVRTPATLQLLARIGYLPAGVIARPTPRWSVETRIMGT